MDMLDIAVKDRTLAGKVLNALIISIALSNSQASVKDIIRSRVYTEVEKYNNKKDDLFNGLVQPTDTELTLNGYKVKNKKHIDPEKQFKIACEAFNKNAFFILIDDKQAESLDALYFINKNTEICFVKLVPLVGG